MIASLALALVVAAGPPPKNVRVLCGCPTARILAHGPQVLDADHAVSAWLHDDAQIEIFQQDAVDKQKLTLVDGAAIEEHVFEGADANSTSRLVRVSANAAVPERAWLGVMRKTDTMPREAVAVSGPGGAPPKPGAPPVVKALWLAPLEQRERPGCGEYLTHMIAFELAEGSPPIEAFLVQHAHTNKTELVDARAAGVFGLGRVEVCDQGVDFAAGSPTHITVVPISATYGRGEPWKFDSDGTGQTDLTRTLSPSTADKSRISDPFPVPGMDDHKGPSLKMMAVGIMATVMGGAAIAALFAFIIIPARRRRMAEILCPSCGKKVPYDALDPKTDGFFCPSCGAAGFYRKSTHDAVEANKL